MISVHFNGEIVRHFDTGQINKEIRTKYSDQHRCKYGVRFVQCDQWRKYSNELEACDVNKTLCPYHKQRQDTGKMNKEYSIDWQTYRKLSSGAHYMIKEAKSKVIFYTLTFPAWKDKPITDEQANQCFSKFAENMRKNYSCSHYIAVREHGETGDRVHFHVLCAIPFISFTKLNNSWLHAISKYCVASVNALQTDKKYSAVIRSPTRAIRYVCKYFSKVYGIKSSSRVVFVSNSLLSYTDSAGNKQSNIKKSLHEDMARAVPHALKGLKSLKIKKYDHVTVFKVTDYKEFKSFCNNFLYPLFECSVNKTRFVYKTARESTE
jgi:hypothetical protein